MRYISADRTFWIEDDGNGNYNLGLTEEKLRGIGEFITCIPQGKLNTRIPKGHRLFAVETHKCLQTLKLPVSGKLIFIRRDLEDDCTHLNSQQILATLRDVDVQELEYE